MDERELESLVEAGLASYGARPPAGLAAKIISECQANPSLVHGSRTKKWVRVASAVAAAGLVAAIMVHPKHVVPAQIPVSAPQAVEARSVEADVSAAPINTAAKNTRRPHAAKSIAVVRTSYVPPPVTEQEQMLATMAHEHPRQVLEAMAMNERQGDPLKVEPLSTAALKIEPLRVEPLKEQDSE